jgi:hypothetical protein
MTTGKLTFGKAARGISAKRTEFVPSPQIPSKAMKKPLPATCRLRSVGVFPPAVMGSG